MKKINLQSIIFSSLLLLPFAHAEIYVEPKVNSWTAHGYLWVIGAMALVVIVILAAVYYENRKSKK